MRSRSIPSLALMTAFAISGTFSLEFYFLFGIVPGSRAIRKFIVTGSRGREDADCYGFYPASGTELGENGADVN
jgi:hypothetical protein